jgi:hypothetical protein
MKNYVSEFFLKSAFLLACTSFLGTQANAQAPQIPLKLEDVNLNAADLTGTYAIQTPDGMNMSPFVSQHGDSALICFSSASWAMDIVKASEGTYYIQWGDKKANFAHNWNMRFGNEDTPNVEWIIDVLDKDTVTIQRSSDLKYVKAEDNGNPSLRKLYTDAGSVVTKFILKKVTEKKAAVFPEAGNFTYSRKPLNSANLSGKYLIQNAAGVFMTPNTTIDGDASVIASEDPAYAFDFTKQDDGTYTITNGDLQANFVHPWLLHFDVLPEYNTWTVTVVEGDSVTIQRSSDGGYLKNEINPAGSTTYKYYTDANEQASIRYALLSVNQETGLSRKNLAGVQLTNNPATGELKISHAMEVRTVCIYNLQGQKVFSSAANSEEISISARDWSKGFYLVELTNAKGETKMQKILI